MFLLKEDYWNVRKTRDKGRGVFAGKPIPAGTIIGDYIGKLVKLKNVDFDKEKEKLYLMYYDDEKGIYPDLKKPGVHLLNHSCSPNCWIYKFKEHTLVFASKDITVGEELTISYLLPPKTDCKNCTHRCFCKSETCTKSMHLNEKKYKKWRNFQDKEEKKVRLERIKNEKTLKLLSKYPKFVPDSYIEKINKLKTTE